SPPPASRAIADCPACSTPSFVLSKRCSWLTALPDSSDRGLVLGQALVLLRDVRAHPRNQRGERFVALRGTAPACRVDIARAFADVRLHVRQRLPNARDRRLQPSPLRLARDGVLPLRLARPRVHAAFELRLPRLQRRNPLRPDGA